VARAFGGRDGRSLPAGRTFFRMVRGARWTGRWWPVPALVEGDRGSRMSAGPITGAPCVCA